MSSSTPTPFQANGIKGRIAVEKEQFIIKWVVPKLELLTLRPNTFISSQIFSTCNNQVEWQLRLYQFKRHKLYANAVAIHLFLLSSKHTAFKTKVQGKLSIPPMRNMYRLVYKNILGFDVYKTSKTIQKVSLLWSSGFMDSVTIRCEIDIPWEDILRPIETDECLQQVLDCDKGRFSQDFRKLFEELPRLSDVTVIVGNEKFPAHKLVLATRSPVFSAMFENEMTYENLEKKVKIEGMEPDVVKAMLRFFYTDEVENIEGMAYGLLGAADKYDVQYLRTLCERFLYRSLNNNNATEILVYTDLYGCYKLKEHVMRFMANHFSDIVELKNYKEMKKKYPRLLKELVGPIAAQPKSKRRKLK